MGEYIAVLSQAYHRNGISGAGFIVSLVRWPDAAKDTGCSDLFVAVTYPTYDAKGNSTEREFAACTLLINPALAIESDIGGSGGPGINAWRGADAVGPAVAKAWHEACCNNDDYPRDPWGCGHEREDPDLCYVKNPRWGTCIVSGAHGDVENPHRFDLSGDGEVSE